MSEPSKNPKSPKPNRWLFFVNLSFQMGVVIVGFSYLGRWLDGQFPNAHEAWFKGLTLLGVALAMFQVIRQVNQLNSDE